MPMLNRDHQARLNTVYLGEGSEDYKPLIASVKEELGISAFVKKALDLYRDYPYMFKEAD